ncbi:alpha/beta fold hydrolase [Streptomyces sp. NPDC002446]
MRTRLVFVHGIGGTRDVVAERKDWLRALAAGARAAGHSARGVELTQELAADARFAYYGDLFRNAGSQGTKTAADHEQITGVLVHQLLLEAVDERLADPGLGNGELRTLRHARAQLAPAGTAQGLGNPGRYALNALTTLMSLPGLRGMGGWVTARLTWTALGQVARYLGRGEPDDNGLSLDRRVRQRVVDMLDPDGPTVVVAHSLGTVVALEALHDHQGPVPLLVTLGSPLGTRTAVLPHVRPHPPQVPEQVGTWLNFWDRDDIVAARPRLEAFVRPNAASVLPMSSRVDSDGAWVHPATKYLAQPAVAGPVVEALESAARS